MLRRSAAAVTAVIAVIVLPYFLPGRLSVLPAGAAQWLLRLTPAAGFAVQQGSPRYPQVDTSYTPANGYFPLAPWSASPCSAPGPRSRSAWPGPAPPEGRMTQAPPAQRASTAQMLRARRTGMRDALHAEWTKAANPARHRLAAARRGRADRDVSAAAAAAVRCPSGHCAEDPAKISLTGVYLGQAVVAILAVLAISGEYSTGMIRTTLAAMPRRATCWPPRRPSSPAWSWPPEPSPCSARCWPGGSSCPATASAPRTATRLSLASGPVLRAAVGSVLYLALIALLSLGAAAAVRDSAAAIGIVLGLLYLFPILPQVAGTPPGTGTSSRSRR